MFSKFHKRLKNKSLRDLWFYFDSNYGLGFWERIISSNWFNPFLTIYLNLRSFPLNQAVKFPIFVFGRPAFYCLSGNMKIVGRVSAGMIVFNRTRSGSPSVMNTQSELYNQGTIIFRGHGIIGTGNKIRVFTKKVLDIGYDFKITDMCNIGCMVGITIGNHSRITHRCQVLDSNYHYVANFVKGIVPNNSKTIKIGDYCWICNTSTISAGAVIPNYTIVASNSLAGKDYSSIPESSIIGGIPAKLIATGFRRVENVNMQKIIEEHYYRSKDVFKITDETPDEFSFIIES